MSPTATRDAPRASGRSQRRPSRPAQRRLGRRLVALAAAALIAGIAAVAAGGGPGFFGDAVRKVILPLDHEDIIRQQATAKALDPALIRAVIYQESKFRPRTSAAGAEGLMQLLPGTAQFIARKSGGTRFELADLADPDINIRYGSWYLRYLMQRYDGETTLAVAAYNGGESNVDAWVRKAGGAHRFDPEVHIPFSETRRYVAGVSERRQEYRRHYARELGLR